MAYLGSKSSVASTISVAILCMVGVVLFPSVRTIFDTNNKLLT